jgi:hypothetical protein
MGAGGTLQEILRSDWTDPAKRPTEPTSDADAKAKADRQARLQAQHEADVARQRAEAKRQIESSPELKAKREAVEKAGLAALTKGIG